MKEIAEALGKAAPALLRRALADSQLPVPRRIFVNRALRMETIDFVGFDLDWTLAPYRRIPVQRLIFELSVDRLVGTLGYPRAIRRVEFRPSFPHRGLMVDRRAGTILKMNRHRYVGRAYLGRTQLNREERIRLYRQERLQMDGDRFYWVDTMFELPEINLFAELVELGQRGLDGLPDYDRLFTDVREAVDGVHAVGTLKSTIGADPDHYLPRDPDLPLALERLLMGKRKLMLITNSDWDYTDTVCRYLFETESGPNSWCDVFDLVIVRAGKPGFFREKRPFEVLEESGRSTGEVATPDWGGVYRGGCLEGVHRLLDAPGERVLYVGDHIYGDIVSSKLTSTWRTALIVEELEEEVALQQELAPQLRRLSALKRELSSMGHQMDDLQDVLDLYGQLPERREEMATSARKRLRRLRRDHKILRGRARELRDGIAERHNPTWGSVFHEGGSQSLFGSQVQKYACIYTSRVSNFVAYGTHHYYRVLEDPMAHDL